MNSIIDNIGPATFTSQDDYVNQVNLHRILDKVKLQSVGVGLRETESYRAYHNIR